MSVQGDRTWPLEMRALLCSLQCSLSAAFLRTSHPIDVTLPSLWVLSNTPAQCEVRWMLLRFSFFFFLLDDAATVSPLSQMTTNLTQWLQ